jgi:hypothetical protein
VNLVQGLALFNLIHSIACHCPVLQADFSRMIDEDELHARMTLAI